MTLVTHGFPKSGTHGLARTCQLLGVPCDSTHLPHADGLPEGTTHDIFIVRDPRNVLVSWLGEMRLPATPGAFVERFHEFYTGQRRSFVKELRQYEPWLTEAGLVVRFEDLCAEGLTLEAREREVRRIATYLDSPFWFGVAEHVLGPTRTFNLPQSDYRTIWTPEVEQIWTHEGGPQLLARWGYAS